jgi:biopolymer transport protein ExbD
MLGTGCMMYFLNTWFAAAVLVAAIDPSVSAQPAALRAGVSVEMPITRYAVAMPEADNQDSAVLAVTAKGNVYFGVTPVKAAELAETVKAGLSGGGKKLYIKVDARTPYADVAKVLDGVRKAGVDATNLLTDQKATPEPGFPVPPKGLEVVIGPTLPSASEAIVVQMVGAGPQLTLSVNNERVSLEALQATLKKLVQNSRLKMVLLKANEQASFRDVVSVIDTCRSVGAKVFLSSAPAA